MSAVGLRVGLPDEWLRGPLRAHERILAAHEVEVAGPQQVVVVHLRQEGQRQRTQRPAREARAERALDLRRRRPGSGEQERRLRGQRVQQRGQRGVVVAEELIGAGGDGRIPAGVADDHAVDPAQQRSGTRDAGLGAPGAGRCLRRRALPRSGLCCRGVRGAGHCLVLGRHHGVVLEHRPHRAPDSQPQAGPAAAGDVRLPGESPGGVVGRGHPGVLDQGG